MSMLVNPSSIAPAIASWNKNGNYSLLGLKNLALMALLATPVTATTPGCAPAWRSGGDYSSGSLVSSTITVTTTNDGVETTNTITKNFECVSGATSSLSHCPTYDPSNAVQASVAWKDLGECTGSVPFDVSAPTPSPISSWNADNGGCPDTWAEGTLYKGGDIVELDGLVYKCSSLPFINLWCGDGSYKPGAAVWWSAAWSKLGSCEGTMTPSASPNYEALADAGGCPEEYSEGVQYQEGDKVSMNDIVYACRPFPNSAFCSHAGYEPGSLHSGEAWSRLGYCDGTISPSSSPAFTFLADLEGCPHEYSSASSYEALDKVTVVIDEQNSVVFQCSGDIHQSRFCNQFEPNNSARLGWTRIGMCATGSTIAPTSAPNFVQLAEVQDGCPDVFNPNTKYEARDMVSLLSNTDERLVYECKEWPYEAYCNAGMNFGPGSDNRKMGWDLKGYCQGTISPTASPLVYPDQRCRWYNGTNPVIIDSWAESDLSTYSAGTRVRIGDEIFKCKSFPNSLWCKSAAYKPTTTFAWDDAWMRAGTCLDAFAPTLSPSETPTKNPTNTPTKSPSNSPTLFPVIVINMPSSLSLDGLETPTTQEEYDALKLVLEQTIYDTVTSTLSNGQTLVTITVTSIGGQTGVGSRRHLESKVVEYVMELMEDCSQGSCASSNTDTIAESLFEKVKTSVSNGVGTGSFLTALKAKAESNGIGNKFAAVVVLSAIFQDFVLQTNSPTMTPSASPVELAECMQPFLPFSDAYAISLERVGAVPVPAANTAPFNYNLNVFDNFDGNTIYLLDQNNGIIWSHEDGTTDVSKVFDISTDTVPAGLTLDFDSQGNGAGSLYRVKAMTQGPATDSVIVVFTSTTLPDGWTEPDASLPAPGCHPQWVCADDELSYVEDIFRVGLIPECADNGAGVTAFTAYDAFYEYTVAVDGSLENPEPFFVSEVQVLPGHLGSGILTLPDGKILWSTGDCTFYGIDGGYVPQIDFESCGKILRIDPSQSGSYSVVAKGVRNSQQMKLFEQGGQSIISFSDIGGVTAEEVNAFPIEALDGGDILNFGWGRNLEDGKAREGTFYVHHGKGFKLGDQPACEADAPLGEEGFVQPWVQFGRNGFDYFFGISGMAIPSSSSGGQLKLIWSEFNTGKLLGTATSYVEGAAPAEAFKLKIFDESGAEIDGLNALVDQELGAENVGFTSRGDSRLFHFPNGDMGVLIERTGVFYKIQEISLP